MTNPRLFVLTGPTAVGKTAWALRWAEAYGAEIVSCDSLLFYRGMDIGTAKPTAEERRRVPHHLIDVCAVTQPVNVVDYVGWARAAVRSIEGRGRRVLVVGGSGFYLKAFYGAVHDEVVVAPAVRAEIARRLDTDGLPALLADLRRLNPSGLGELDCANPRRVARALERCLATGRSLAELQKAFAQRPGAFAEWSVQTTRLECDPAQLDARIGQRVEAMLAEGLEREVQGLLAAGLESNPSAARAIGYRETVAVLRGERPRATLAEEIARDTRALVKKQRTWFRTQLPEHRVLPVDSVQVETLFER